MAQISPQSTQSLKEIIDSCVSKPNGVPGLVCSVINRDGNRVFEYAAGKRALGSSDPMTVDSVFWIASCTKLVTTIAAMQLVEQERLALDDGDEVEKYLPELKDIKVLVETADGTFSNAKLKKWSEPIGINEITSEEYDIFGQPLIAQPGEQWEYGVNIDWVGRLIERVTSVSLGEYFQEHIFAPLGLSRISFLPSAEMKKNLAGLHQRASNGKMELHDGGHVLHRPLVVSGPEAAKGIVNAGGHEIISTLLNYGIHPKTKAQVLKKETVAEMLKNQIPQFPDFGRNGGLPAKPSITNPEPELYAQINDPPQGWGLSFFLQLHPEPPTRAVGSVFWTGVANLIWWADFENGIGGIFASQILPYNGWYYYSGSRYIHS
ncbi:hypothetical protein MPDQ_002119 [Monascus purpureus]|uniref:Beta-lactamase-related domain-containing protein n=1 Tax=Monascus purpureus TaxID=5098 RepID=A0A507QQG3_MONPU|nr:hypothetical protein MPDQ_002119 [Monascus purpureus]